MSDFTCPICDGEIERSDAFAALPRVTSDSKPWPAGGEIAVCYTFAFLVFAAVVVRLVR